MIGANLGAEDDGPDFFDVREAFLAQDGFIGLDVQDLPDEQGVEADFQGVDQLALQDQGEFRRRRGRPPGSLATGVRRVAANLFTSLPVAMPR